MSRSLQTLMIAMEGVLAPEFSSIEAWLGSPDNTLDYYAELKSRGSVYQPDQSVHSWVMIGRVRRSRYKRAQDVAETPATRTPAYPD